MITYQDMLSAIGEGDTRRESDVLDFVKKVIRRHQASELYQTAQIADEYDRQKNRTITRFQKILYTMSGEAVPDLFGACYRIPSRFFNRFVTQENQYLLGNGVSWDGEDNPLGDDFDYVLQDVGKKALCGAVSFGFMNLDLHRITAKCDSENLASEAVMKRIGMRKEGETKKSVYTKVRGKEQWRSEKHYAMLQKEFLNALIERGEL